MITEEMISKGAKNIEKKLHQIYGYEKNSFLSLAYKYSSGAILCGVLIGETVDLEYLAEKAYDGWREAFYEFRWTWGEKLAEDVYSDLLEKEYVNLPVDEQEKYQEMAVAVLDMLSAR